MTLNSRRLQFILAAAGIAVLCAAPALAQREGRGRPSTVFKNARIVPVDGPVIESGNVIVSDGTLRQIGKDATIPDDATVIDAQGLTITPGLVDVDGTLAVSFAERGSNPDPTNRVFDAFDRYAKPIFRDAVRNGVTSLYISPRTGSGITGTGAVVRLQPASDGSHAGVVMKDQAALCIDLGSAAAATQRLDTFDRVRRQFKTAVDYRESLETYKEELQDYEKKIKERADKEAKDKEGGEKPAEGAGGTRGPGGGAGGGNRPPQRSAQDQPRDGAGQPQGGPPGGSGGGGGPGGEKKDDEIKKPVEPSPDRKSEVLLKAVDRELPVRIRCERSEDILNALDLVKEFSLNAIIEGGTEAYLLAPKLAKAQTPVVLGPALGRDYFQNDQFQRRDLGGADALSRAGVQWLVGSGRGGGLEGAGTGLGEPSSSRFVLANAQLLVQHVEAPVDPLRLVTADAAAFLGVGDKVGRLRPGMLADIVLWTGDPLDPGSHVKEVYIGGELVYRADDAAGGHP